MEKFEVKYAPDGIGLDSNEEATNFYLWAFGDIKETRLLTKTHMESWNNLHGDLLPLEPNKAIVNDLRVMVDLWRRHLKLSEALKDPLMWASLWDLPRDRDFDPLCSMDDINLPPDKIGPYSRVSKKARDELNRKMGEERKKLNAFDTNLFFLVQQVMNN